MSAVENDVRGRFVELPRGTQGPVTASRHRRNALVYAALAVLGLLPTLLAAGPGWQAAGLGLLVPGGGFVAWGGASVLLLPLTLCVSCLANVWAVEARLLGAGDFRNTFVSAPPDSVRRGPVLAHAAYPEVLVAKAFSHGEDLDLVLYPGAGNGRRALGLERLRPGARYLVRGAAVPEIQADMSGCARFEVDLAGRTALHVVPA